MSNGKLALGASIVVLFLGLLILWKTPHGGNGSAQEMVVSSTVHTPTGMIVVGGFISMLMLWVTCCSHNGGGGGGRGEDKVHRVYPKGAIALAVILPTLFVSMVGASVNGIIGFLVGVGMGGVLAFIILLYLSSAPEYSNALLTDI
jgi:hypothetical protein